MKYRIELTGEQMRVLEDCCNLYMRLLMGQKNDLTRLLTEHWFYRSDYKEGDPKEKVDFERYITKRDSVEEMLGAIMRISYGNSFGTPKEKSDDCMIAECMWDAIRYARGTTRWDKPFQIGSEPSPKIEVIEDD